MIEPAIIRQTEHCHKNGIVTPEVALAITIRWLSGCTWWSCCRLAGCSRSTFHAHCHRVIIAIIACEELRCHFPTCEDDLEKAAADFNAISSHGVIKGCVGALDGLLVETEAPSSKQVANPRSFFSGHCHRLGINVQAACDAHCRFTHFDARHPGSTNDAIAHAHSQLPDMLAELPLGKFIVADNACQSNEHLITPFQGPHAEDPAKSAYNYFVSQLRIRIECAFGRMVAKFCILKRPLRCSVAMNTRTIHACTILHNFCINKGQTVPLQVNKEELELVPQKKKKDREPDVNSALKDHILKEIDRRALRRPHHNVVRNSQRK